MAATHSREGDRDSRDRGRPSPLPGIHRVNRWVSTVWLWWSVLGALWALQFLLAFCPSLRPGFLHSVSAFLPAFAACALVAFCGTARPTGGFPWTKRRGQGTASNRPWFFGHVEKSDAQVLNQRRRRILDRCRRTRRFPVLYGLVNFGLVGLLCLTVVAQSLPSPSPARRVGLLTFLVAVAVCVVLGNQWEGPLLEALSSRRRLDRRGRELQAAFQTGVLGLLSWVLLIPIYAALSGLLRGAMGHSLSPLLACCFAPLAWQIARRVAGRQLLGRVVRRGGPFEWVPALCVSRGATGKAPAAELSAAPLRWASWLWALGAALLALPFGFGMLLLFKHKAMISFGLEELGTTAAAVAMALEGLSAGAVGFGVVFALRRGFRAAGNAASPFGVSPEPNVFPTGAERHDERDGSDGLAGIEAGSPTGADAPPLERLGWRRLLGPAIPWLTLWGALLCLALPIPVLIQHQSDQYAVPMFWIVATAPIGLFQACAVGWAAGVRRRTAPAAAAQALWVNAFWWFVLANAAGWSLLLGFYALHVGGWLDLDRLLSSNPPSRLRSLALLGFDPATTVSPDVFIAVLSVWLGRILQVVIGLVFCRQARHGPRPLDRLETHPWGGPVFRWHRMLRGNPVVGRTLGVAPHGGRRWYTALRIGTVLAVAIPVVVGVSYLLEGGDFRAGPPRWLVPSMVFLLVIPAISGGWAALLGVLAARKARLAGEDQELHLSLLRGEEVVSGRLMSILLLTVLWAALLPIGSVWLVPFVGPHETELFFVYVWAVCGLATVAATAGGDAAVGLWWGSRGRSAAVSGFIAVLWGLLMGSATTLACAFGPLFTVIWLGRCGGFSASASARAVWMGLFGLGWAFVPVLTRLSVGDWLARRLADDLVGADAGEEGG